MRRKLSMELRSASMKALLIGLIVIGLDQFVKVAALRTQTSVIVPERNPGVFTGWAPVSGSFVTLLSAAVLIVFVALIGRWAMQIGVSTVYQGLIAGGMLAHSLDRIRFGGVRDFLVAGPLIIDVADIAVAVGLTGLVVALALRAHQFHREARTIGFEIARLRVVVKDA